MTRRIKRVGDLPAWFELSKYSQTEKLDATGWYEQLTVRKDLQILLGLHRQGRPIDGMIDKIMPIFQTSPIVDLASNETLKVMFYGGCLHELKESSLLYSPGVRLTTVRDLYRTESLIYPDIRRSARSWAAYFLNKFNWLTPTKKKFDIEIISQWINEPVFAVAENCLPIFTIDLDLPDSILINQFRQVLESIRDPDGKYCIPKKSYPRPNFANWTTFAVLPYMDLKIWATLENVSIPNRVIADAIFKAGEGGEEVVRKTTEKLAQELVTDGHLNQLAAFAAYEISEQKST